MALGLAFRTSLLSALCMCNKKVHKKLITGRHVVRYTDVDGTTLKARTESEGQRACRQWAVARAKGQFGTSGKADSVVPKQVEKQTPVTGRVTGHHQE
jgi:hypothetical protein